MASKRKSTTPCMIPSKSMHLLREELEQEPPVLVRQAWASEGGRDSPLCAEGEAAKQEAGDGAGTYTCRPCNFETRDLNLFLDHVYSGHPDFRADPSFLCVDCGASAPKFEGLALHNARVHPSTMNTTLQLRKRDRRVVVEQNLVIEPDVGRDAEISITKTPIMRRLKGRSESKRIVVSHPGSEDSSSSDATAISSSRLVERKDSPTVTVTHVPTIVHNGVTTKVSLPSAVQIVNGLGSLPMLKTAITQVVSVVQNRTVHQSSPITVSSGISSPSASSKNLPKVMIPLSSIPTYSASMDSSPYLKTSFSKFSYPTKAELCYLTVVTKFPEEQIKIWFTAQRLKQGISWSPEEIEDARRKMFNTIIQTAPSGVHHQRPASSQHTITVLPAAGIPHILQGSLVSQGGVIVTQPVMANGFQVSGGTPMALAVTPKPQATARPMMQARPATTALVADKGISMVVGTVGSSGGGSNVIINSSRSIVGGATSFSSSNGIRSGGNAGSQASVINLSLGNSNHSNINSKINIVNGKMSRATVDAVNGKSNGNADSAKSSGDNKNVQIISNANNPSTVKSPSENKPSTDVKKIPDSKTNDAKSKDTNSVGSKKNITSGATITPTSAAALTVSTAANSAALRTEAASSPASKSASPSPAFHPISAPGSRTPNALLDASSSKSKKSQGQLNALKDSFQVTQFPNSEEVDKLIGLTGLTVREVRKWFSDRRYHFRNLKGVRTGEGRGGGGKMGGTPGAGGGVGGVGAGGDSPVDVPDGNAGAKTPQQASAPLSPPPSQTPTSPTTPSRRPPRPPSPDFTAIRYKEREPHQLRALEASFAEEADPSGEEVDRLRTETKMTRREIHGWFAEKRKKVAAERKREEAERAVREEDEMETKEAEAKGTDGVRKEEGEDKQKDDSPGGEPKVNPIKINLKMLKVTEANGKPESETSETATVPPLPGASTSPAPPSSTSTKQPQSQSPKPLGSANAPSATTTAAAATTTATAATTTIPKPSPLRGKKTAEQLHLLKQVYARTQWPSAPQYDELITGTGLPRPEVVRWFGDCRYVQKNGQLKWLEAYQGMALEEDLKMGHTGAQTLQDHLDTHGRLEDSQVKELSQASGLTEDLVRFWFSTKTTSPLLPPQAQADAPAPDRTGHVSPGTTTTTETQEPERTGVSESLPLKAQGESEEPKANGGTKEEEEKSSEPTPSKGRA
ncbi:unnamed protein product [Merluccius merluccius]